MTPTTTTVTVPANGTRVTLDPGTCFTAVVVNAGTVWVYAEGYIGEPFAADGDGYGYGPPHSDGSRLGPGQRRTVYPTTASPITAWTETGTAGQVTVTIYPQA